MEKESQQIQGTEEEFLKMFHELCYCRMPWEVWTDIITAMACSIANTVDRSSKRHDEREIEYERCIARVGSVEKVSKLFAIMVVSLERNPEQDFLGKIYMNLGLGDHWKGQFFTPYSVCQCMAQISIGNAESQIKENGYISVCDPACGAGATLIAAANTFMRMKYNFQNHVLFVGQDIDRVTGMMCYIQLSLLGCPGYVCIANSLTNPVTGHVLYPNEKDGQELWYMPMFGSQVWNVRRLINRVCGTVTTRKTVEKEHFYMFFDYDNKEVNYGR